MPASSNKHDASAADPAAVVAAQARIEQRAARDDREQRIEDALNKLRYGTAMPAGYHGWNGELLRIR